MKSCNPIIKFLLIFFLFTCVGTAGQEKLEKKILIITGENNHDWKATTPVLRKILEDGGFVAKVCEEQAVLETKAMNGYDGILLNYNRKERWEKATEEALLNLVRSGKALIVVHASNNAFPSWKEFDKMVGLVWREGAGHDKFGKFTVKIIDEDHPITKGIRNFEIQDELYHSLTKASDFRVLATSFSKGKQADYPMLLVKTYGRGRIFHTLLGHNVITMENEGFQKTLLSGTKWAVGILR